MIFTGTVEHCSLCALAKYNVDFQHITPDFSCQGTIDCLFLCTDKIKSTTSSMALWKFSSEVLVNSDCL